MILPLLPYYAKEFGASGFDLGLIVASYAVCSLLGSIILGNLSDKIGRKPILLLSLVGSTLGQIGVGFAPSLFFFGSF